MSANEKVYAISSSDLFQYGCPHCGCCRGNSFISTKTATSWFCETCGNESWIQLVEDDTAPFYLTDEPERIICAIHEHPRKLAPCVGCNSCGELVEVVDTGRYVTPGCFVTGGEDGEHNSLVIKTSCNFAAQHIARMFEAGAAVDGDDLIIIGASQEYQTNLNSLMLHIIRTGRINAHTITKTQRMNRYGQRQSEAQPDHRN